MAWLDRIDRTQACWHDYLPLLERLPSHGFPGCEQLNTLFTGETLSANGQRIHFVSSTNLADGNYEHRIYTTGQVSTRPGNWHDLFNALVWLRFPHIKSSMNALHVGATAGEKDGSRGQLRDGLTLFDECGVIVFSGQLELLDAIAQRDWKLCFQEYGAHWHKEIRLAISGHAMLEKFLATYKSMTANALLVLVNKDCLNLCRDKLLQQLDEKIAGQLRAGKLLTSPRDLAPLPLAGIPKWWSKGDQDDRFYADRQVFRAAPVDFVPAPVTRLS